MASPPREDLCRTSLSTTPQQAIDPDGSGMCDQRSSVSVVSGLNLPIPRDHKPCLSVEASPKPDQPPDSLDLVFERFPPPTEDAGAAPSIPAADAEGLVPGGLFVDDTGRQQSSETSPIHAQRQGKQTCTHTHKLTNNTSQC